MTKDPKPLEDELTLYEEIQRIRAAMGQTVGNEGDYSDRHWSRVLTLLIQWRNGDWDETIYKLSGSLQMTPRNVRESYLEVLKAWGIIRVTGGNCSSGRIWNFNGAPKTSE